MGKKSSKKQGSANKKKKKNSPTKTNDTKLNNVESNNIKPDGINPDDIQSNEALGFRDFSLKQDTFVDNLLNTFRNMDTTTKRVLLVLLAVFAAALVIVPMVILWPKGHRGNTPQKQAATVEITNPSQITDAYNKGNYKEVIPGLEKYIRANKNDLKMRELLASSYFLTGDSQKALNEYQDILKAKNEDPDTLYKIGVVLEHMGREKESIEYLSRAVHASPNTLLFRIELARASAKGKYYANAVDEWKSVLNLLPADDKARADVLAEIANIYITQNNYTQAKEIIATGLAINPNNQTLRDLEAKIGAQIQPASRQR